MHSLKDLPTQASQGVVIVAIPVRADARDVLIGREAMSLKDLPVGGVIATGSPRRVMQLRAYRSDLALVEIRGNIDTRLRKLREQAGWSGIVLAAAGIQRLKPDLAGLHVQFLPFELMLPAPGQGALALQARDDDSVITDLVAALHDKMTAAQVTGERSFLQGLGGGCQQPIAAYARIEGVELVLQGRAWLDRERAGVRRGPIEQAGEIGRALAEDFRR